MAALFSFVSSVLSYLLLAVIMVAIGAVGFILGKTLRLRKNAQLAQTSESNKEA